MLLTVNFLYFLLSISLLSFSCLQPNIDKMKVRLRFVDQLHPNGIAGSTRSDKLVCLIEDICQSIFLNGCPLPKLFEVARENERSARLPGLAVGIKTVLRGKLQPKSKQFRLLQGISEQRLPYA